MPKDIRKKILDATMEVIAKEKISGTRMHLIAEEACMTQSNLHYYYPTKNDLLIALLNDIQDWFSQSRKRVVDLERQSFEENLHGILEEKKEVILHHPKLDYVQFDYWVQGMVDPEMKATFQRTFNIWRQDIEEVLGQHESEGSQDSPLRKMLPYLMVSLMMGASMQYLIAEDQFDLNEYFATAETIIQGLLKTEG